MLTLSAIAKAEKNRLDPEGVFILLLELIIPMEGLEPIRVCYNTEDITWNSQLWQAFPLEIGEVTEDKSGSIPSFEIRVDNTSRALTSYIEASNGANNADVIIRVVNSKNLAATEPELEEHFRVARTNVTESWVTMTVSTEYNPNSRRPIDRYSKNNCRYKEFGGALCGYTGSQYKTCNRTLSDCRKRGCSKRYGGFAGVDQGGIYV